MKPEADEGVVGYQVTNRQVGNFHITPRNNQVKYMAGIVGRFWGIQEEAERL